MIKWLYCLLCFISFFVWIGESYATPTVTSVSGNIVKGSSVTVTGDGFGTGPTIYKWDDFEGDTHSIGSEIGNGPSGQTAWTHYTTSDNKPRIASGGKTNSTKYVEQTYSASWIGGFVFEYGATASPVYITYWFSWSGTITGANVKLFTVVNPANCNSWYYAGPCVVAAWQSDNTDITSLVYDDNENCKHSGWGSSWTANRPTQSNWIMGEFYGVESDTNRENGTVIWSTQRETDGAWTTFINYPGNANTHKDADEHWVSSVFGRYASGTTVVANYDDIYIADSRARVEIGDHSTWANCNHREIQIPTVWSDTSITITVNQGSFGTCDELYLFVVDADGNANAHGYPVQFPSTAGKPCPPTDLKVIAVQ